MKKSIILVLLVTMLFGVVGCGDKKNVITCTRDNDTQKEVIEITLDKESIPSIIKMTITNEVSNEENAKALADLSKNIYASLQIDYEYSIADGKMTSILTVDVSKVSASLFETMFKEIKGTQTKKEIEESFEDQGYKC